MAVSPTLVGGVIGGQARRGGGSSFIGDSHIASPIACRRDGALSRSSSNSTHDSTQQRHTQQGICGAHDTAYITHTRTDGRACVSVCLCVYVLCVYVSVCGVTHTHMAPITEQETRGRQKTAELVAAWR